MSRFRVTLVLQQTGDPVATQNATRAAQNAEQARANADRIIETAIQEAERAAVASGQAQPPGGDAPIIFTKDNGQPVTIDFRDGNLIITQEGTTKQIPWDRVVPSGAVDVAQAVAASIFFLVVGWPIARAIARWIDRTAQIGRSTNALSQQVEDRFAAMERNIDTVAIEVEKLSEAQRFTTKLLAERADRVPVNAQPH